MLMITVIILFFTNIGILTLLDSKLICLFQMSVSNVSFNLFGLFQFFMDFLKLVYKFSNTSKFQPSVGSMMQVIFLMAYNLLFLVILYSNYYCKSIHMSSLLYLVMILTLGLFYKIFSVSNLVSSFNVNFLNKLGQTMVLGETISFLYDILLISLFSSQSVFNFLLSSIFEHLVFKFLLFVFLIISLLNSFSLPFDYMESESELLNSMFLNVFSLEYSLWVLVEYSVLFNKFFYSILLVKLYYGLSMFSSFLMLLFFILFSCVISALYLSYKLNFVMIFLLLQLTITFLLVFIITFYPIF